MFMAISGDSQLEKYFLAGGSVEMLQFQKANL